MKRETVQPLVNTVKSVPNPTTSPMYVSNKMIQEIADTETDVQKTKADDTEADEEYAAINSLFGVSEINMPQTQSIQ